MRAYCQVRHGGYIVDLGFISLNEAKSLAQAEAIETNRTMTLWYYNNQLKIWEALSEFRPSSALTPALKEGGTL